MKIPSKIKTPESPIQLGFNEFYFYGNVPSYKNSKRISCVRSGNKTIPKVTPSLESVKYLQGLAPQLFFQHKKWLSLTKDWGAKEDLWGLVFLYQFIRPSQRSVFDFSNAVEVLQDAMTGSAFTSQRGSKLKHIEKVRNIPNILKYLSWIQDDNNLRVLPAFHPEVLYDPECSGVVLRVFRSFEDYGNWIVKYLQK